MRLSKAPFTRYVFVSCRVRHGDPIRKIFCLCDAIFISNQLGFCLQGNALSYTAEDSPLFTIYCAVHQMNRRLVELMKIFCFELLTD